MREYDVTVSASFTLRTSQCWECRRFYAYEKGCSVEVNGCPFCIGRYWRNAQAANEKRTRTINALRGVISRLKRGRR